MQDSELDELVKNYHVIKKIMERMKEEYVKDIIKHKEDDVLQKNACNRIIACDDVIGIINGDINSYYTRLTNIEAKKLTPEQQITKNIIKGIIR